MTEKSAPCWTSVDLGSVQRHAVANFAASQSSQINTKNLYLIVFSMSDH